MVRLQNHQQCSIGPFQQGAPPSCNTNWRNWFFFQFFESHIRHCGFWCVPLLRTTIWSSYCNVPSLRTTFGSVSGASLHSVPPLVRSDGFNSSFHSGRLSILSRSFQHLLWLMGATRDSFVLEIPVVPKEERRKIERLT